MSGHRCLGGSPSGPISLRCQWSSLESDRAARVRRGEDTGKRGDQRELPGEQVSSRSTDEEGWGRSATPPSGAEANEGKLLG